MSAFLPVAIEAARSAGKLLREALGGPRRIDYKGHPTNLVTEMDGRSEALIVDALRQAFPDHAVLGEEGGARAGAADYRWLIDPLDGTTNYAHGLPVFGVSIALETERRVVLGVVYDPTRDELFVAEGGRGATLNDVPVRVSATPTLNEALLTTGFPYDIRETDDTNLPEYAAFAVRARAVRRMGSAVIDLAYVACGRFDGFWELSLGPWDVAAGGLLVEEAGGILTGIDGGPMDVDAPTLLASNGLVHEAMLSVLKEVRTERR